MDPTPPSGGPEADQHVESEESRDPPPSSDHVSDYWVERPATWIRTHVIPRTLPFIVSDALGVNDEDVESYRTTHVRYFDGTEETWHTLNYRGPEGRQSLAKGHWVGETVFTKRVPRDQYGHALDSHGHRIRKTSRPS